MKVVIVDCNFESFAQEEAMCKREGYCLARYQCRTADEVLSVAAAADALLVQYAPITAEVIRSLKRCKVIVRYGIGVDMIDLVAAAQGGIPVCNVPDYGIDEVADHAMALALTLCRQLPWFDREVRNGAWPSSAATPLLRLSEMTFGILGLGRIGRAVLERARPFGFRFVTAGTSQSAEELTALGVTRLDWDALFEQANVLSLHMPLTDQTRHMVAGRRLQQMKPSSIIVNTARGGLIDTQALAEALLAGSIAAAGLDVFEGEPLASDHPLRGCQNALLTPHLAYYSSSSIELLQRLASEEVERALKGLPLRCSLDLRAPPQSPPA